MRALFLDASTLVMIVAPNARPRTRRCYDWARERLLAGDRLFLPAIAYHETLRGALYLALAHGDRRQADRLAAFAALPGVARLPLPDAVLDRAAHAYASARAAGRPLDDRTLSGDTIIGTQAAMHRVEATARYLVTENVRHLGGFLGAGHVVPFDEVP